MNQFRNSCIRLIRKSCSAKNVKSQAVKGSARPAGCLGETEYLADHQHQYSDYYEYPPYNHDDPDSLFSNFRNCQEYCKNYKHPDGIHDRWRDQDSGNILNKLNDLCANPVSYGIYKRKN